MSDDSFEHSRDPLTAAYQEMVRWLVKQAPRAHGSQAWAAKRLKISPQHLSNVMNGSKIVGPEVADRATEELGLDPDYFGCAKIGRPLEECRLFLRRMELPTGSLADIEAAARVVLRDLASDHLTRERAMRFVMQVRRSELVEAAVHHASEVERNGTIDGNAAALASVVLREIRSVLAAHEEK